MMWLSGSVALVQQAALRRVTSSRHGARLLAGANLQQLSPRPAGGAGLTRQASSQSVRSALSAHSAAPSSSRGGGGGPSQNRRQHRRQQASTLRATLSGPAAALASRPGLLGEAAAGAGGGGGALSGRHHAHRLNRRHRRNGSGGSLSSLILSRAARPRVPPVSLRSAVARGTSEATEVDLAEFEDAGLAAEEILSGEPHALESAAHAQPPLPDSGSSAALHGPQSSAAIGAVSGASSVSDAAGSQLGSEQPRASDARQASAEAAAASFVELGHQDSPAVPLHGAPDLSPAPEDILSSAPQLSDRADMRSRPEVPALALRSRLFSVSDDVPARVSPYGRGTDPYGQQPISPTDPFESAELLGSGSMPSSPSFGSHSASEPDALLHSTGGLLSSGEGLFELRGSLENGAAGPSDSGRGCSSIFARGRFLQSEDVAELLQTDCSGWVKYPACCHCPMLSAWLLLCSIQRACRLGCSDCFG